MQSVYRRRWRNWSGSVEAVPNYRVFPTNTAAIQAEVLRSAEAGERLRVGGSGQSFAPLCWTDENLMSLDNFIGIESCDHTSKRVWVRSGTRLVDLAQELSDRGLALEVMGQNGRQTLAGAISTGTHGSGTHFGSMSTLITGVRMACADGSLKTFDASSGDVFDAVRLSLGALGVITHVELQCVSAYRLHERSERTNFSRTISTLERLKNSHRHFAFSWFPHQDAVWLQYMDTTGALESVRHRITPFRNFILDNGALQVISAFTRNTPHLSDRINRFTAARNMAYDRVGEPYRRYDQRRFVRYNETSFAIPAQQAPDALEQIGRVVRALQFNTQFPIDVQFVARDNLWLSPSYQRDTAFISARMHPGLPHEDYFAAVTEILDRYEGRPHWGTIHQKTAAELAPLYPKFADFQKLRAELDPRGVFLNPHLCELLDIPSD